MPKKCKSTNSHIMMNSKQVFHEINMSLKISWQAVKASHDHDGHHGHHSHHGQHQEELFVGRAMHEVWNTKCFSFLIRNPGFSCARQDKPKPLKSLHQLWRAGGGKETLRGSCAGEFNFGLEGRRRGLLYKLSWFLATLVALHFTPVSE